MPAVAPSCGDLQESQDFSTAAWALLSSVECLWQEIHTQIVLAAANVGKGNICECPLTVKQDRQ